MRIHRVICDITAPARQERVLDIPPLHASQAIYDLAIETGQAVEEGGPASSYEGPITVEGNLRTLLAETAGAQHEAARLARRSGQPPLRPHEVRVSALGEHREVLGMATAEDHTPTLVKYLGSVARELEELVAYRVSLIQRAHQLGVSDNRISSFAGFSRPHIGTLTEAAPPTHRLLQDVERLLVDAGIPTDPAASVANSATDRAVYPAWVTLHTPADWRHRRDAPVRMQTSTHRRGTPDAERALGILTEAVSVLRAAGYTLTQAQQGSTGGVPAPSYRITA